MKKTLRAFSFFMALICLFAFSLFEPAFGLTQLASEGQDMSENIDALNNIWDEGEKGSSLAYSPIVGELTDQRSEDTKRLRRADGAIELIMYSDPVHYELDGRWEQIDNTLVAKKTADGKNVFENIASDFKVKFGANENTITVEYRGETVTFSRLDTEKDAVVTAAVKEKEATRGELTDEESDELWRFPEELSSAIVYSTENTRGEKTSDIEYRLNNKSLSEFITLNEKPAASPVYRYSMESSLTPVLEGNVVRFENSDGETVLKFSAPYMTDANGEESYDFKVSLEEDGEGYIYTMIPSEEWLYAEERVYPVVIDPDVETNFKNNVQNSYVGSRNPAFVYGSNPDTKGSLKVGDNIAYCTLIRLENMETLDPGDVIIYASVNLTRFGTSSDKYGKEIDAYRMNGMWNESTVTWNIYSAINEWDPYDSSRVETFALSSQAATQTIFDITDLYKKWYEGAMPNYGILLTSGNYACFYSSRNAEGCYVHPYFSIIYVNSTGLESHFSYSSQSAGRAGTGSVNLYSGNLTFTVSDASINNGTMPISVSHAYNTNDKDTDIGYGYGWRLNYAQSIKAISLNDNNTTATYYEYIDGDGTRHYYKKKGNSNTEFVNELDKDSNLKINGNTLVISDKAGNNLEFDCEPFDHDGNSSTAEAYRGRLVKIADANGNATVITYNSSDKSVLRIASITEKLAGNSSNGQSIMLSYNGSNRLSGITAPNGLNQTYGYNSSGDLISIGYTDDKSATYTYSAHKLTKATNIDNYNINYEYNADNRVTKATEQAGTTVGNYLNYEYGWNVTTVTDKQNRDTIYQFNNAGQAVSVRNAEGQAVFAAYNKGDRETTQLAAVSKMQNTVVNLLANHGFDIDSEGSGWDLLDGKAVFYGGHPHAGRHSVKLLEGGYVQQESVAVEGGKTYTLSAYFTSMGGGYVEAFNGTAFLGKSDLSEQTAGTAGQEWTRRSVTFTVPTGVSSITVRVGKETGTANFTWADSAQLEVGETPNRYNMIVNSDFTNELGSEYTTENFASSDGRVTDSDATHPANLSNSVIKIVGDAAQEKYITQSIKVENGAANDTYSFGGWCRSDSVPMTLQKKYGSNPNSYEEKYYGVKCLEVTFLKNGSKVGDSHVAYFGADTMGWQFVCSSAVAEKTYDEIQLSARFDRSRNEAYFDGLQLYRERFSQAYTYDENGNLTGYTSLIGQEPKLTYDSNNDMTSSVDPRAFVKDQNGVLPNESDYTTYYTYDNKHNVTSVLTPKGTKTEYTYDTNGNVTQTKVGNSTNYIKTSTAYDNASALATAVTDARGNSVTYGYNSSTRQQTSITDAKGNTSTYSYSNATSMLRLASLASAGTGTVNYSYDSYGKLTQIKRGQIVGDTTEYNFGYDSWGRLTTTKVGSATLSTNVYDTYGRLLRVDYGNGFKTEYEYDNLDRTSKIYERANASAAQQLAYEFVYNGEGDLYELRNHKTNPKRAVFFEYDHGSRCMASTEKSFTVTNGKISYSEPVSGYKYEYDVNNNLTKLTCTVAGSSWTTTYTYDEDNRPTVIRLNNGRTITDTYDGLGRITNRSIGLYEDYETNITYIEGNGENSTTALVESYKNGDDAKYNYTYDANGNITQIWRGDETFASATEKYSYSYNAANQLVRENLYYGSGNSNNKTVTYEYDGWGNIQRKLEYAYTTSEQLSEPVDNYILEFDSNGMVGGSFTNMPEPISANPGSTITLPSVSPQQTCYGYLIIFTGWNTAMNGRGTSYAPGATLTLNGNMTLYAQWRYDSTIIIRPTPTPPGIIMGDDEPDALPTPENAPMKAGEPTKSGSYPVKAYIYNYADRHWKDKLTSIETYNVNSLGHITPTGTENLTYDSMGNPTQWSARVALSWEGKQLTEYSLNMGWYFARTSYTYDENGLRTSKNFVHEGMDITTNTNYYYNGSVLIGMRSGNTVQRFTYDAQGKVVSVSYNGADYYYVRNAQGDIVKLVETGGATVVEYTYDSWGKILSTTGTLANTVGKDQPFRYRGYVYDNETQWYYLQSRYYDPSLGRFVSSDVYLSTGQGVLGHNSYAYCNNNPICHWDPYGFANVYAELYNGYYQAEQATVASSTGWTLGVVATSLTSIFLGPLLILFLPTDEGVAAQAENVVPKAETDDPPKSEPVFCGMLIDHLSNKMVPLTGPMNADTAEKWVHNVATAGAFQGITIGKRRSWGLYTFDRSDAEAMMVRLGTDVPLDSEPHGNGYYRHFHPAGHIFSGGYQHFHIWYGLPQ